MVMSEHSFIPTIKVKGFCPVCAHPDPEVGTDGFLHCTSPECPSPDLIANVLLDNEIHHIVRFYEGFFNVKHPMRERLTGDLLNCAVHDRVVEAVENGFNARGTWRFKEPTPDNDDWIVEYL